MAQRVGSYTLRIARSIDWWFVGGIVFLLGVGLLIQYSIGVNQDPPSLAVFYKQLAFAGGGMTLFVVFSVVDHRLFTTHPVVYFGAALVLLISVLLFGREIQGTTGWFIIGPVSFQPVELVKALLILFMSVLFGRNSALIRNPKNAMLSGAVAATFIALVILQPDLGSAIMLFGIWFAYPVVLRSPKWFIALVLSAVVMASMVGWFFLFADYQKQRLSTFIDPSQDPLGTGYNITQSIIAVGSGSLWGRGLGSGTQSQLHFLPEVNTDFIFAVIAEEFGFIGVLALLFALGMVLFRLWRGMVRTRHHFSFLFLLGTTTYVCIQSVMTIGMNIGLLPVTGVPLPLISAGGSSMLMTLFLLGIAHNVIIATKEN